MSDRANEREWLEYQWPYLLELLGGEEAVERMAREHGAFTRSRKIRSPSDLLRLLLIWSAGEYSLGATAAIAAEAEVADVSDVALLKRFARCRAWMLELLSRMLEAQNPQVGCPMRALDATVVCKPGSRGTDHRIHLGYDLRGQINAIELTDARGGESFDRFEFQAGEIAIGDRGYAHREALKNVAQQGAFFIVRFAWRNVPLEKQSGEQLNILEYLRSIEDARASDLAVQIRCADGTAVPCRLVAIRKSEPAAAAAREAIIRERRKKARRPDLETLEAAGYFFVLTNLALSVSAEQVLEVYRLRWQIEIRFKSLKSVIHLSHLPVKNHELAQTYLAAKLLIALLIDLLIDRYDSFSPWGYPISIATCQPLAFDSADLPRTRQRDRSSLSFAPPVQPPSRFSTSPTSETTTHLPTPLR